LTHTHRSDVDDVGGCLKIKIKKIKKKLRLILKCLSCSMPRRDIHTKLCPEEKMKIFVRLMINMSIQGCEYPFNKFTMTNNFANNFLRCMSSFYFVLKMFKWNIFHRLQLPVGQMTAAAFCHLINVFLCKNICNYEKHTYQTDILQLMKENCYGVQMKWRDF
jgi:hypothetical protein